MRDQIDMDPPYQRRGRLWSPSDKGYLIDSIINGYDVPKLYLADFQTGENPLNPNRLPFAIIDGKQRLEAIFDFFDGTLTLNHDFKWRQDETLQLGGLSLRDLRANYPQVSETFENESLDIMSVVTSDEDEINELFVRLNRSKPLTGAEIRNAMTGPVSEVTRTVSKHEFFSDIIRFSVKRAADYNAAGKILLFEYQGKLVSTKKSDLDKFARGPSVEQSRLELSGRRCVDNLDRMVEVFLPKDELLSSAGIMPVYYWLVRQVDDASLTVLREFLLSFERDRKRHRDMHVQGGQDNYSSIYSRYDALNRSTNDGVSHVGRVEILERELGTWALQKGYPPPGQRKQTRP
ncbi:MULTISPECIES: DUF262 domain-containing protein [unclassified Mesorhizobium]|uniref:DUF262 domain-containing protein n=1 Tax=unclassified Mesorhizobium TaxID=325217 RepID=UPI001ABF9055|nr:MULTISPECIES: DUF262 domain-containing protein [unclassified Mesorhizobium]